MKVIAMTGKDGGKMAGLADVEIRVPHFRYADRIQEIHIKVIHILMMLIEFEMAKSGLIVRKNQTDFKFKLKSVQIRHITK